MELRFWLNYSSEMAEKLSGESVDGGLGQLGVEQQQLVVELMKREEPLRGPSE